MKEIKKIWIVLMLFITLGLFADGVEPLGSGTETDPYQISILENLLWVNTNNTSAIKYYIQTDNINASETAIWNNGEGFSPIGKGIYNSFYGRYDGCGFIIDSLTINRPTEEYVGMFSRLGGAILKNITLTNVNISGAKYLGALVGQSSSETDSIDNCKILSGSLTSEDPWIGNYLGGLVGFNKGTINNCHNSLDINTTVCWVGGLVGENSEGTITNSSNSGHIIGNALVGGLVGYVSNNSTIEYSFSTGAVGGDRKVGGFIGGQESSSSVYRCYSSGDVTFIIPEVNENGEVFGGFIGQSALGSTIRECYSTGNVYSSSTEDGLFYGGFIGNNWKSEISNCYSLGTVIGNECVGGFAGKNEGEPGTSINNCYSIGNVIARESEYESGGGFIGTWWGAADEGAINNSFWNVQTSGYITSFGGMGLTTAQMNESTTYTTASWDFVNETANGTDDLWMIDPAVNNGYPILKWTTIIENSEPYLGTSIADQNQLEDFDNLTINLNNHFMDDDGDLINYEVSNYDTTIVNCQITDSLLTIISYKDMNGETPITITASQSERTKDIRSNSCIFNFTVEAVNDAPELISFTPVDSVITIAAVQEVDFSLLVNDVDNSYEDLEFSWFVNNEVQTDSDSTFTYNITLGGEIIIKAIVSDGLDSTSKSWTIESTVSISEGLLPLETTLHQNYPNPFNPVTTIKYDLKETGLVKIAVYNTNGALVKTLINNSQKSGFHSVSWNGRDNYGKSVASGLYLYKMKTGKFNTIKRAMLVK